MIGGQILHVINQLAILGIIPDRIQRYSTLVNQSYVGHATIFPTPKFTDFFKIVKNPTAEFVA